MGKSGMDFVRLRCFHWGLHLALCPLPVTDMFESKLLIVFFYFFKSLLQVGLPASEPQPSSKPSKKEVKSLLPTSLDNGNSQNNSSKMFKKQYLAQHLWNSSNWMFGMKTSGSTCSKPSNNVTGPWMRLSTMRAEIRPCMTILSTRNLKLGGLIRTLMRPARFWAPSMGFGAC